MDSLKNQSVERLKLQFGNTSSSLKRPTAGCGNSLCQTILILVNVTTLFVTFPSHRQHVSAATAPIRAGQPLELHSQIEADSGSGPTSQEANSRGQQLLSKQVASVDFHPNDPTTLSGSSSSSSSGSTASDQETKLANNIESNALNYLQKYGYMGAHSNAEANNLISEDSFSAAISSFQRFAGIPETGLVDELTVEYMQMPRCGNVDKPIDLDDVGRGKPVAVVKKRGTLGSVRRKRYALQGSKWRRQELTYRISQYPTRFSGKRQDVDAQIEKAFGIWSQVAPINFIVKKEGRVHIDIRFASGDHGDGDAFDGPGNTLAHAYFPQYGGDAHFDDQEYWTIDSFAGTNIFQVAAHELGHSLGLGHSNVREALMAPFYQKYKPNFRLHIDDVLAIQGLYGEKPFLPEVPLTSAAGSATSTSTSTSYHHHHYNHNQPTTASSAAATTTTAPTSTTTSASPSSTARSLIPTTFYSHQTPAIPHSFGARTKPTYFGVPDPKAPKPESRESNEADENSIPDHRAAGGRPAIGAEDDSLSPTPTSQAAAANQPADLCTDSTIDAITRTEDGSSYVFKGDFYWLLTNDGLAKGYPRKISNDWDGLPGSIDAALTWADGKTFFFKGNKYWRFRNRRRDVGYPKLISAGFAGIPDDIDAAFVWSGNGRTYIFKGAEYWRFDSKADPPVSSDYPRSIKVWNGVPAHINAAFKWQNNVTYFFKGNQYYRFNDKEFRIESRGRPPFPRLSSKWWFGCATSNLAQKALPNGELVVSMLEVPTTTSTNFESQEIGDWSFFAGLEENRRIMGTHISDQRPAVKPQTVATNSEGQPVVVADVFANSDQFESFSTNRNQLDTTIGSQRHTNRHPKSVSSSAISANAFEGQHLLLGAMFIMALALLDWNRLSSATTNKIIIKSSLVL